jgi:hypothetical protein
MSDEEDFKIRLSRMAKILKDVASTPSVEAKEDGAIVLMTDFFHVGLALERKPELRQSPEFVQFFESTLGDVVDAIVGVDQFICTTERKCGDTWYDDEWTWVCERRSGVQFFLDLYSRSEISAAIELIEVRGLDQALRHRGEFEGHLEESEIPPGIPYTHWWWWLPKQPPVNARQS